MNKTETIGIIGLGYVGLPLALALAKEFDKVVGFDISHKRIETLRQYIDYTDEVPCDELRASNALWTQEPRDLLGCSFFIVAVPTPVDHLKKPDLIPLMHACETVGTALKERQNDNKTAPPVIVFESTGYPGLTEEICLPELEKNSRLKAHADFLVGYSPERINPGDKENRLENIRKIISAEDETSLARIYAVYNSIIKNGVFCARSIKVAEAAKVLENTQRDLNIALMNEMALICDRLGIATSDVLRAAETKWNFHSYRPGLVGGHCIGVDPYYLTTCAERLGYIPQVIHAGRAINEAMPSFLSRKAISLLVASNIHPSKARVGILGITFKEDVRDSRNSRVPDLVHELRGNDIQVMICDPLAISAQVQKEYGLELCTLDDFADLDAIILAVPHKCFLANMGELMSKQKPQALLMDIKSAIDIGSLPEQTTCWRL